MASKFLSGLTPEEYKQLTARLHQRQNGKCFICGDAIELGVSKTDIDHIIPLANKGKDDDVKAKRERAATYCQKATTWAKANGYKPWTHLFIPDNELRPERLLADYVKMFSC